MKPGLILILICSGLAVGAGLVRARRRRVRRAPPWPMGGACRGRKARRSGIFGPPVRPVGGHWVRLRGEEKRQRPEEGRN